ncbi:MAG TPA: GTP cyclohydrolase, FolE2/MptA family [Methylococcus sp.]|nr:GTP cyclohydrolase, FolE2/MptA family [Methylococcus sp.]
MRPGRARRERTRQFFCPYWNAQKIGHRNRNDRPKLVEDLGRDIAIRLDADPRITAYVVEAENLESIHNHAVYARIDGQNRRAGVAGF